MLVPVRYSIRRGHKEQTALSPDHEVELERQIMNQEIDFEYRPNEMEGLFAMDQTAQEIRKMLLSSNGKREFEKVRVSVADIQEIVLVSEQGDFALLKVKKDVRDSKYSCHSHVGVSLSSRGRGRISKDLKMRNET